MNNELENKTSETASVYFLKKQENEEEPQISFYTELDDSYYELYYSKKRLGKLYRGIFLGFGLLFLILANIVYFKTSGGIYQVYFNNFELIKTFSYSLCLFLSLGAFGISYSIRPKNEAIEALMIYIEKKSREKTSALQKEFLPSKKFIGHQILSKMHDHKQRTLQFLNYKEFSE